MLDACPKRMVYGPCGGAHPDGTCEVVAAPCTFPAPTPLPAGAERDSVPLHSVPLVLTDFSTPPFDQAAVRRTAAILAPSCDAVLVGEHQDRPDFPPTLFAQLLRDAGLRPWITLACRDRNRVGLEQELRGLRQVGAAAVLCVTGDARAYDVRPDVTQVFDLDGPRLAMLAADEGLPVAVPETITAAPVTARPRRLVDKQRCGASVAVLNHVADPAEVAAFVAAARDLGLTIPVIAAVAVYTDAESAASLSGLPGLALDETSVRSVLGAGDPRSAGIDVALTEARRLLAIEGVVGVNVSGQASARGWEHAARVKAELGERIRGAA
ncbi:methylenetetrahydrofolate reductase C-terminal domain-containing protein [uncultured Jatrophihabitans sp.]|uniref:methylenetetrahydrofolate reductase C-terminal domain-containing protein n=1 Tax=uncultured Jatrophihabitans sp. TaxID=1610747 RepID=UPI0035CBEAC2